MKIDIKTTGVELTSSLRDYVEGKIGSLDKFLKRWELEGEISVWVELDRTTEHHHKGKVFRAAAEVHLPKHALRAEELSEDLRSAVDAIRDKLKLEIKKYKEKIIKQ